MRIIHFSDFHLCSDDRRQLSEENIECLIKSLEETQLKEGKRFDLVIFSGDLVNKGGNTCKEGLSSAFADFQQLVIAPICKRLGVAPDHFIFVPGNHDVNRKRAAEGHLKADETNVEEATKQYDDNLYNFLNNEGVIDGYILGTKSEPRIDEYKQFEADYYVKTNNTTYINTSFDSCITLEIDGHSVGIAMLNSAWRCFDSNHDAGRILIGERQIKRTVDSIGGCDLLLAVSHHHPNQLTVFDQARINKALCTYFDFFFYGHTHFSDPHLRGEVYGEVLESGVGGQTPDNNQALNEYFKNGYVILDYDFNTKTSKLRQFIKTQDGNYIIDPQYAPETNHVWEKKFETTRFEPMNVWVKKDIFDGDYITNDVLQAKSRELLDPTIDAVELVAFAGFGKTRFVYETYKEVYMHGGEPQVLYCRYHDSDIEGLEKELTYYFDQKEEITLVIDNCPHDKIRDLLSLRGSRKWVRLIAINNEYYASTSINGVYRLVLPPNIIKNEVDAYIRASLQPTDPDSRVVDDIIMFSDGFPDMAKRFIKSYHDAKGLDVKTVEDLVSRMVRFDNEDNFKAMQTMSLFLPMPYGKGVSEFEFIINNKKLNPLLLNMTVDESRRVFTRTKRIYSPDLIEYDSANLRVRPAPLAIWIVSQWLQETDESDIGELLEEIKNYSQKDYHSAVSIIDAFAQRLSYMQENQYARQLLDQLMDVRGSFHSEKVACSDMGSRLFLAMASVNPVAVGRCLYEIIQPMTTEEVRNKVEGHARRYLTWALEKICYNKDSYKWGFQVMARFALAENESWGNNSTAQLKQLFHIALPGTQCSLQQRVEILRGFVEQGEEYHSLVIDLCEFAFHSNTFSRMGGVEPLGHSSKEDYRAQSNREILQYWVDCTGVVVDVLRRTPSVIPQVKKLLITHAANWIFESKYKTQVEPIYLAIKEQDKSSWPELYYKLLEAKRIWSKREVAHNNDFSEFLNLIRPEHFVTKVLEEIEVYLGESMKSRNDVEIYENLQKRFEPLVKEFLEQEIYGNRTEVERLLRDIDYGDYGFANCLQRSINDEQLATLVNTVKECFVDDNTLASSGFFRSMCYQFHNRKPIFEFYDFLRDNGYTDVYVTMLANAEDAELRSLLRLKEEVSKGLLPKDFIDLYLRNVSMRESDKFKAILKELLKDGSTYIDNLMFYAQRCLFLLSTDEGDAELMDIIKRLCIAYEPKADKGHSNLNLYEIVEHIVESDNDVEFAVAILNKTIDALKEEFHHDDMKRIVELLLVKYPTEIWPYLSRIFTSDDYVLAFLQIKDEIGSGIGFGIGCMFSYVSEDSIKQLCFEYQQKAPHYIAQMVPVFGQDHNTFSDWIIWLIDNFGQDKSVLDGIGSNVGSFGWSGSVLPLYRQQVSCFEKLQKHQYTEVREWATQQIRGLNELIEREQSREAYMRMKYDL